MKIGREGLRGRDSEGGREGVEGGREWREGGSGGREGRKKGGRDGETEGVMGLLSPQSSPVAPPLVVAPACSAASSSSCRLTPTPRLQRAPYWARRCCTTGLPVAMVGFLGQSGQ